MSECSPPELSTHPRHGGYARATSEEKGLASDVAPHAPSIAATVTAGKGLAAGTLRLFGSIVITFTWSTNAFGPWVGWMRGSGIVVAGVIVLANLAQIAGTYFWLVMSPAVADSVPAVAAIEVIFTIAIVHVNYREMEIGERRHHLLHGIPLLALVLLVVLSLGSVFTGQAPDGAVRSSFDWFDPFAFTDFGAFTDALILSIFIYRGWDISLAINVETKDPAKTPARTRSGDLHPCARRHLRLAGCRRDGRLPSASEGVRGGSSDIQNAGVRDRAPLQNDRIDRRLVDRRCDHGQLSSVSAIETVFPGGEPQLRHAGPRGRRG